MNNVKDTVLDKIKEGEVAMRPRWHFVLKGFLLLVGMGVLALWLIYLVSFIVFALVTSGVIVIPFFGFQGLVGFLLALPWLLILVAAVFIVLLEILVNKYSFGYRKPLLYTLFGVVGFTVIGTFLVSQSGIHDLAMQRSVESRLPLVGGMYKGYGIKPNEQVHIGEILAVNDNGFVIDERMNGQLNVVFTESTRKPPELVFKVGDKVIVFGSRLEDEIEAFGVKHFSGKTFRPVERIEGGLPRGE
jgi:hypothetical protein